MIIHISYIICIPFWNIEKEEINKKVIEKLPEISKIDIEEKEKPKEDKDNANKENIVDKKEELDNKDEKNIIREDIAKERSKDDKNLTNIKEEKEPDKNI